MPNDSGGLPWQRLRLPSVDEAVYLAALILLVAAPLIRGWRFVHSDVVLIMPDLNETWLSVQSASHLDQNVGPWSRIGLFHLGPMWFSWCVPFLALAGGEPSGLFLAALALAAVSCIVIVEQVRRSLGTSAGLVAAAALAVVLVLLDPTGVAFAWNPTVLILPTAAAMVCVARSAATRTAWSACLGIVFSWFVVQTHLGALPLGALLLTASTALVVRASLGDGRRRIGALVVAGLCLIVPVVPIARDQVSGTANAGAVARYVLTGDVSPRFPDDPPSESQHLGIGSVVQESASVTTMIQGGVARWAGADILRSRRHQPSAVAPFVLLALVAVAALAAARLWRSSCRRNDFLGWLGLVAAASAVVQTVVAVRARDEFRPYLIAASAGVGAVLWLVVALQARQALVARAGAIPSRARWALKLGACLVLMVSLWRFMRPPLEGLPPGLDSSNQASEEIAEQLGTRHVRVRADRIGTMAATQRLVAALERDGMVVSVDGREIAHFSDRQRHHDDDAVGIVLAPVDPADPATTDPIAVVEGFAVIRT